MGKESGCCMTSKKSDKNKGEIFFRVYAVEIKATVDAKISL